MTPRIQRAVPFLALTLLALPSAGGATPDAPPPAQQNRISTCANGSVGLEANGAKLCSFTPLAATPEWKFAYGVKAGALAPDAARFALFSPPSIQGHLAWVPGPNTLDLTWRFEATQDVAFNTLGVEFKLPIPLFSGGTWRTDQAEGTFPVTYGESGLFGADVSSLAVTAPDGTAFELRFPTPTRLGIEDDRRWGSQAYKLRFGTVFGKLDKGASYQVRATLAVPGEMTTAVDDEVLVLVGQDWVPLVPLLDLAPGSALDLSGIRPTDGECGSKGRVIATPDGHFAFADDPGTPRRFYGANLCFGAQFLPKENVDALLDRWLRMGYNTLRIHHYESGFTTPVWKRGFDWDPNKIDQFCYLIAGCSKRGIWLTTDLYVSRPVTAAQIGVPDGKPYVNEHGLVDAPVYKALVLVHEPAFEDFKKFTAQLLDTVNPYTRRRLAEEPALAWLSLVNEGAPGGLVKTLPQWKAAWNAWLAEKYPKRGELAAALGDLKDTEVPADGTVGFPGEVMADTARGRVCLVFLAEMERRFVDRMRSILRDELKCPALLTNHNCPPNSLPDLALRESFDYVDDHFYIDHPVFEKGWGLPSRCPNENPVREGGTRAAVSTRVRLWGKPMTVSEFNFSGPGRYRGIGALMTGALAALQDWDVLWRFAYAHNDQDIFKPAPIDYFNMVRDPMALAADRAAVMLFLRGDLKTPSGRVAFRLPEVPDASAGWGSPYIPDGLAWTTRMGNALKTVPEGAVAIPFASDQTAVEVALAKAGLETGGNEFRSETGELKLDRKRGVLTVDTACTAGGYADAGESIEADQGGVSVKDITTGATVFATSLDGKPIHESARILVTHLTDLQNTGARYGENARQTLLSWGGLPYLVRDGRAAVALRLVSPESYQVWELSMAGQRIERVPAVVADGQLAFTASVRGRFGARMLYEVTTDAGEPDAAAIGTLKAAIESAKSAVRLRNGDMTEGAERPSDWEPKSDVGELKAIRDTVTFASAPSSLRLESVGGRAKGMASQRLNLTAGETVDLSAHVRAEGDIGYAALVMLAVGGTPNWNPLANLKPGEGWQAVSTEFTAPPGTNFCLLLVFMDGEGQVWLDDAEVKARTGW